VEEVVFGARLSFVSQSTSFLFEERERETENRETGEKSRRAKRR